MHREFKKDGLGFGFGPHRCIAESLSKAELTAVFSKSLPVSCVSYDRGLTLHRHAVPAAAEP